MCNSNKPAFRHRMVTHLQWYWQGACRYFDRTRAQRPTWQKNTADLRHYPPGTLGYELGKYLTANDLPLIRYAENYPIYQLLLGYDTGQPEASEMQFCLLGSGHRALCVLGTCAIAWLAFPVYRPRFKKAFVRGQQIQPFHHWYFEYLLDECLDDLRQHIGLVPPAPENVGAEMPLLFRDHPSCNLN